MGKIQPLWGVTRITTKSYITLQNSIEHIIVYCPFQTDDKTLLFLFIHFNQITPHPCLNVTSFLSVKILQHSSSIQHVVSQEYDTAFSQCENCYISQKRTIYYPLLYIKRDHPCHVTVASVVVIVNFHVVQLSIWVTQFVELYSKLSAIPLVCITRKLPYYWMTLITAKCAHNWHYYYHHHHHHCLAVIGFILLLSST
jgi:hypothetical protein